VARADQPLAELLRTPFKSFNGLRITNKVARLLKCAITYRAGQKNLIQNICSNRSSRSIPRIESGVRSNRQKPEPFWSLPVTGDSRARRFDSGLPARRRAWSMSALLQRHRFGVLTRTALVAVTTPARLCSQTFFGFKTVS
jgi:hypothetical protein